MYVYIRIPVFSQVGWSLDLENEVLFRELWHGEELARPGQEVQRTACAEPATQCR